jgi:hypothetical protein
MCVNPSVGVRGEASNVKVSVRRAEGNENLCPDGPAAEGTDYLGLGPSGESAFAHDWPVLRALLQSAEGPMTRQASFRAWPESAAAPAKPTSWKWLSRAVREGHVPQHGEGTRKEPYQYSLRERVAVRCSGSLATSATLDRQAP